MLKLNNGYWFNNKSKSCFHLFLTWPGWGWCLYPSRAGRSPCGRPASCPASRGASCRPPWTPLLWRSSGRWGPPPRGQSGCGCRSCRPGWTWWSSYKLRKRRKFSPLIGGIFTHDYHLSGWATNLLSILCWVQIWTGSPFLMFRRKLAASSRVNWPKSTLFTWKKKEVRIFYIEIILIKWCEKISYNWLQ